MPRKTGRISQTSFDLHDTEPDVEVVGGLYRGKGCWMSPVKVFILILLAILMALIVGLLVHFFDPTKPAYSKSDEDATNADSSTGSGPNINYRLPRNLMPSLYTLRLKPDIYTGDPSTFNFQGSVKIDLDCNKNTDTVVLHSRMLNIDQNTIRVEELTGAAQDGGTTDVGVGDMQYDSVREFLTIPVKQTLEEGKKYRVSMNFKGPIKDDLKGIYYSSYTVNDVTTYVLASQLQPTDSRKVFPCLDEPNFKAQYDVTVERQDPFTSMANGDFVSTEPGEGNWKIDRFARTPIMSTYLLAFIVSNLECVDSYTNHHQLVQICARPNAMDQVGLANESAAPLQMFFENYHNVSYPLNKTVHAAVPDFAAGAMENWGLIIYRDYNLLYNPVSSTSTQEQRIVVVLAHELAHMWFGDLVSMDWWDDVWLNEGFASYMEVLGTGHLHSLWNMEDDMILDKVQGVMESDSLATSHPVFQPADSPAQIIALFDSITYDKGASIIRMMHYFLGNDTFRWGLSNYLKALEYKTATHGVLFDFLTEEASRRNLDINVAEVMNTWILQLGYPVVKFDFNKTKKKKVPTASLR